MKKTKMCIIFLLLIACVLTIVGNFEASASYSIYCSECGRMIDSNSKFCMYCGHRVNFSTGSSVQQSHAMIPQNPSSLYGRCLRENLINGVYYSDAKKVSIVSDTFYGRKDSAGNRKSWYYSTHRDDIYPNYRVELYYADGVLFFANITKNSKTQVTLHYWGDEIVACRDFRGYNDELSYVGSSVYNAVNTEFSNLYSIALRYAP